MLQEMFPDVSEESIRQRLVNCGGILEVAANQLTDRKYVQYKAAVVPPRKSSLFRDKDWSGEESQYYLVVGYLGTGWAGFQFNDNIDTGQGALLQVLYDLDAVRTPRPHANAFMTSRTDKTPFAKCSRLPCVKLSTDAKASLWSE